MPRRADARITRLEPLKPRGLRVRVHVDRGKPFEVALEALERAHVGSGDILTPPLRTRLRDEDLRWRVREAALNLLSHRARSRTELRRRLLKKGFSARWIDECLRRLQERGLLNDEAVAAAFVRDRLNLRPRGRARLRSELRGKGIDTDLAERVVDQVLEDAEVTDRDLAFQVLDKWIRSRDARTLRDLASDARTSEHQRARRRLYGFLARRGFRGDELRAAMERAARRARGKN